MKTLYRKYRPVKLEEVVGQPQVTEPLISALKTGKVGHAYLFVGPRGCGKTSVARILAHQVNGFPYEIEDDYVDIIEIDGASNRGIDNIRELREKVAIAPTAGKYKVYIIDEVHMLTKEAFNALLKTLEEPPEHVIFIMATTDAHKVPVTITSRAQTYTFQLADADVMLPHLKMICGKEGIKIADGALEIIARRGGGSFRDSLSLLDQISTLSDGEITKEQVVAAMGLPEDTKTSELIDAYLSSDLKRISGALKMLLNSGIKAETVAEELIRTIVAEPRAELMDLLSRLPEVKAPYAEAKLLVALSARAGNYSFSSADLAPGNVIRRTAGGTALLANPSGSSGIYISSSPNQDMLQKKNNLPAIDSTLSATTAPDASASAVGDFSWEGFIERVKAADAGIAAQLAHTSHDTNGDTLNIYPEKSFVQKSLTRDKNKAILIENAGGLKVVVHDLGANPNAKKDELISKMSDIMGGEVENDGGGNPF